MKKIAIIVSVFVAAMAAVAAAYVIKNINEEPPLVVDQSATSSQEPVPSTTSEPTLYTTSFQGIDTIHWGRGEATVTVSDGNATLSFGDDFEVAEGPDLFVYLSPNGAGEDLGEFASLGQLHANQGVQEYVLPANYADYKTVVIWCRAFGTTFATAEFNYS